VAAEMTKTCSKCSLEKPLSSFTPTSREAGEKRQAWCKECYANYMREYRKDPVRRAKYNATANAREKAKYADNAEHREKKKEASKAWRSQQDPAAIYKMMRNSRLKREYGITQADFDRLAESQAHKCAICGREKKLAVDHCHETGRIRGLLCTSCNALLGWLGDQPEAVARAFTKILSYLGTEQEGKRNGSQ
jgi:hypothetical protein